MNKRRIAIFASGEGSNAQRIIDYFKNSKKIEVALILSNKADANVLNRANASGISNYILTREEFYESDHIVHYLLDAKIDLIVLAGFLWMIPENLINAFPNKIVNIHPALLPKFGGKGMYGLKVHEAVVSSKEKKSGISIHFVNEKYDEGKIISQHECDVSENESAESLANKIHQLEHTYFPQVIEQVILSN